MELFQRKWVVPKCILWGYVAASKVVRGFWRPVSNIQSLHSPLSLSILILTSQRECIQPTEKFAIIIIHVHHVHPFCLQRIAAVRCAIACTVRRLFINDWKSKHLYKLNNTWLDICFKNMFSEKIFKINTWYIEMQK